MRKRVRLAVIGPALAGELAEALVVDDRGRQQLQIPFADGAQRQLPLFNGVARLFEVRLEYLGFAAHPPDLLACVLQRRIRAEQRQSPQSAKHTLLDPHLSDSSGVRLKPDTTYAGEAPRKRGALRQHGRDVYGGT